MTHIFGGRFVKWTSGLIWGIDKDQIRLNSFGAWALATHYPYVNFVIQYNHRERQHFMRIFNLCAVKIEERR